LPRAACRKHGGKFKSARIDFFHHTATARRPWSKAPSSTTIRTPATSRRRTTRRAAGIPASPWPADRSIRPSRSDAASSTDAQNTSGFSLR
jgi:hypothetical protein